MAKLVLAAGVPHPPRLVFEMQQAPGKTKGEALMKQVREQVEKAEPDLIIEVDSDHFVNFFYNNLPSFCIGMAEEAQGPQETWCPMPRYTVRGHVPKPFSNTASLKSSISPRRTSCVWITLWSYRCTFSILA